MVYLEDRETWDRLSDLPKISELGSSDRMESQVSIQAFFAYRITSFLTI